MNLILKSFINSMPAQQQEPPEQLTEAEKEERAIQGVTDAIAGSLQVQAGDDSRVTYLNLESTDPKLAALKGLAYSGHLPGWPGPPSRESAEAYANQTLVNMFARVVTGDADIEEAVKIAEDELKAVYES